MKSLFCYKRQRTNWLTVQICSAQHAYSRGRALRKSFAFLFVIRSFGPMRVKDRSTCDNDRSPSDKRLTFLIGPILWGEWPSLSLLTKLSNPSSANRWRNLNLRPEEADVWNHLLEGVSAAEAALCSVSSDDNLSVLWVSTRPWPASCLLNIVLQISIQQKFGNSGGSYARR
jgi:hypothetical protein